MSIEEIYSGACPVMLLYTVRRYDTEPVLEMIASLVLKLTSCSEGVMNLLSKSSSHPRKAAWCLPTC